MGLVEVQQGRGTIVMDQATRKGRISPLARWLNLHRREVSELLEVRGALDSVAAQKSAEHGDQRDLAAIRRAAQEFLVAVEEGSGPTKLAELDMAFHLAIADACGNQLAIRLLHDLNAHLGESRVALLRAHGRAKESAREHIEIVDAMYRDPAEAGQAAWRHVHTVRQAISGQRRPTNRNLSASSENGGSRIDPNGA
jgi:DNA-binding FadR family transcriptional regulator